jgi:hypothetical protein
MIFSMVIEAGNASQTAPIKHLFFFRRFLFAHLIAIEQKKVASKSCFWNQGKMGMHANRRVGKKEREIYRRENG